MLVKIETKCDGRVERLEQHRGTERDQRARIEINKRGEVNVAMKHTRALSTGFKRKTERYRKKVKHREIRRENEKKKERWRKMEKGGRRKITERETAKNE